MKLIFSCHNFAKTLDKEHLTLCSWYIYDNPSPWSMFVIETEYVLCDVLADGEEKFFKPNIKHECELIQRRCLRNKYLLDVRYLAFY
jgi:hypothetical protein